jgi:hypothetical protein
MNLKIAKSIFAFGSIGVVFWIGAFVGLLIYMGNTGNKIDGVYAMAFLLSGVVFSFMTLYTLPEALWGDS